MSHELFMNRCIEIAQRARGQAAPNPMVGALLVYKGRIIGEGWHHNYGADHAEINCLRNVSPTDRHLIQESTLYVNLEPCAHFGITPPCSMRIVEERIKTVVISNTDPFDKVSGKGVAILKDGGVEVITGVQEKKGIWLNRRFFCFHKQLRPYIILKWAQTTEGYIAPPDKTRLQISNSASQLLLHKWRTEEGGVMVGTNTALNDNPQLTARFWSGKQPLRIVIDRTMKLPHTHHVFNNAAATYVINERKDVRIGNIQYIKLNFDEFLLSNLLKKIYESKILSVMIEGGATLLENFISQGLWDEARIFTGQINLNEGIAAPKLTNAKTVFSIDLEGDSMHLFVNKNSEYAYVDGMEI